MGAVCHVAPFRVDGTHVHGSEPSEEEKNQKINKGGGMTVDDLAARILADVGADFKSRGLGSMELQAEYVGIPMVELEAKYGAGMKVDFDLAVDQLEDGEFVGTGPMEGYGNDPGSSIIRYGWYSKREYVYLTEKGYRELQKRPARQSTPHPTVHISGGHFHQSPIGVGGTVNQTVTFAGQQDLEDLQRLIETFETHLDDLGLDLAAKRKVAAQVATIKAQLEDEPDPVIVKQAGRTLRNITEGTVASVIATAATTPGVWEWVHQALPRLFG